MGQKPQLAAAMISPSVRRGIEGFLLGAVIFAVASIAAPAAWKSVSPVLCTVNPPAQRFPGFACTTLGSVSIVLWLGPAALPANALSSGEMSLGLVQLVSAAIVGLLAAGLFVALGRRKGFWVFSATSLVLIAAFTLVTISFAVW